VRWPFVLGIVMAALGGCLVTLYRPETAPPVKAASRVSQAPGRSEGGGAP
jgi:hypothetical protein